MKWKVIVKDIGRDNGVIMFEYGEEMITIPAKYLPEGCRIGDVLQVTVDFSPFDTLNVKMINK
jgi:hypothetical protein